MTSNVHHDWDYQVMLNLCGTSAWPHTSRPAKTGESHTRLGAPRSVRGAPSTSEVFSPSRLPDNQQDHPIGRRER